MLHIVEHGQTGYKPRTKHNADKGHVTAAFAVDFTTAGEKLTHTLAGDRYVGIPLEWDPIDAARALYLKLKKTIPENAPVRILNVAGNGIRTLSKHRWTQQQANLYVYTALAKVQEFFPLTEIISGGQTGIDLAGGVAGVMLDLETVMTFPKGLLQRHETGPDREHTETEIVAQVNLGVEQLRAHLARQSTQPAI